jgi:hypothetical protein
MCVFYRQLTTLLVVLLTAPVANAWVETTVISHVAELAVGRDGNALIEHKLLLKVRGGPLRSVEVAGVDGDAELLPDATASNVRAAAESAADLPVPLLPSLGGAATLSLRVEAKKGLRQGTYLFRFRYRTKLLERGLLRPAGSMVELRWTGPRLTEGIDSVKAVFRFPPADQAPRLRSQTPGSAPADEGAAVFASNVLKAHDKDELEAVRLHVAKNEAVEWRVLVSPSAFDAFAKPVLPAVTRPPSAAGSPVRLRGGWWALFTSLGLIYALLVFAKWRSIKAACRGRNAEDRALIPIPTLVRAVLAGTLLGAAAWSAQSTEHPALIGALLTASMALAVHLSPKRLSRLRGPGRWVKWSDEQAFAEHPVRLPGRWLDTGSPAGLLVFAAALVSLGVVVARLLPGAPYQALLPGLVAAALVPIFCTGRASELPPDPALGPRRLLKWLAEQLRREAGVDVTAWVRIPRGEQQPDEVRLLVSLERPLPGLIALEVGVQYQYGMSGSLALPCAVVRVEQGSMAYDALARDARWQRGRRPEERVALIQPELPTRSFCLTLVRQLSKLLSRPTPDAKRAVPARHSSSSLASSLGKTSHTSNPSNSALPPQAT